MHEHPHDDRRATILQAAFTVFVTYGFKRATMADIATAAGVSRPALYLVFPNKEEIFKAKFLDIIEWMRDDMRKALAKDAPLDQRLVASADVAIFSPYRMLSATPHGMELFDMKREIGGELAQAWFAMFEGEVAEALAAEAAAGRIALEPGLTDAGDVARLFVSAMEGIKLRMTGLEGAEADCRRLATILVRGLAPRP